MSLKQSDFVLSLFFSDSEDEPANPNIIYEEPDDEAASSDKDVSDATLPARSTFKENKLLEQKINGGTNSRRSRSEKTSHHIFFE
ncbi:hypothetical protein RND71_001466 [Anisodus tanguticus]|uniref:Uncharacterized protein n=1 Tax=Anisodus tanguticus TaxID=243964 RepID=A0AAE1SZD5_9SOLA|nr:hypothetical protein RND71_001466 [Anisodus tanguticus]